MTPRKATTEELLKLVEDALADAITFGETYTDEDIRDNVDRWCHAKAIVKKIAERREDETYELVTLIAGLLNVHEDMNQELGDAISFSESFGDDEDNAERFDNWAKAGMAKDQRKVLRRAYKLVGPALIILQRVLGPGAHFWQSPGTATGAQNWVEARDASGLMWGVGQTENQAIKDAAANFRSKEAKS